MSLYSVATKYNGSLEATHALSAHDTYDVVECGVAGRFKFDLLDQLRRCSIASTHAIRLSSNNELV